MCTEVETTGLEQELISDIEGERVYTPGIQALARKSAAEGCVLLKNDGILPFPEGKQVSLFGRCHVDTFYVGYGSGGDVHPRSKRRTRGKRAAASPDRATHRQTRTEEAHQPPSKFPTRALRHFAFWDRVAKPKSNFAKGRKRSRTAKAHPPQETNPL